MDRELKFKRDIILSYLCLYSLAGIRLDGWDYCFYLFDMYRFLTHVIVSFLMAQRSSLFKKRDWLYFVPHWFRNSSNTAQTIPTCCGHYTNSIEALISAMSPRSCSPSVYVNLKVWCPWLKWCLPKREWARKSFVLPNYQAKLWSCNLALSSNNVLVSMAWGLSNLCCNTPFPNYLTIWCMSELSWEYTLDVNAPRTSTFHIHKIKILIDW